MRDDGGCLAARGGVDLDAIVNAGELGAGAGGVSGSRGIAICRGSDGRYGGEEGEGQRRIGDGATGSQAALPCDADALMIDRGLRIHTFRETGGDGKTRRPHRLRLSSDSIGSMASPSQCIEYI
eukprot:scaffold18018_cov92-Isochrysis_galbana.AAC.2